MLYEVITHGMTESSVRLVVRPTQEHPTLVRLRPHGGGDHPGLVRGAFKHQFTMIGLEGQAGNGCLINEEDFVSCRFLAFLA